MTQPPERPADTLGPPAEWPADFFDTDLSAEALAELGKDGVELESIIYAARRDTDVAPL